MSLRQAKNIFHLAILCAAVFYAAGSTNPNPGSSSAGPHGVDIIAETIISVTNKSQTFHWAGYGMKLHIPPASLPAGVEKTNIVIKASLGGPFQFPDNTKLVSPVFWLQCPVVFAKPVTLELQHCGKHSSALSFVRANHSQKNLPYLFKPLEGTTAVFSSYGRITLFSFSGLGIIQESSEEQRYCARLYYFGNRIIWRVHFVVIKDLEAFITVVNQEYKKEGAIEGPRQDIEFEEDRINMEIPEGGSIIGGWTIIALTPPMIIKKNVDSYERGRHIPSCQLKVKWNKDQPPVASDDVDQKIMLHGAKEQLNYIIIESNPLSSDSETVVIPVQQGDGSYTCIWEPSASTIRQQEDDATEERCKAIDSAAEVIQAIEKDISDWKLLGEELGISPTDLEQVNGDQHGEQSKLRETVHLWQRRVPEDKFCWEKLINTLKVMKEARLAKSISNQCGIKWKEEL